jgi:hypothetical protein
MGEMSETLLKLAPLMGIIARRIRELSHSLRAEVGGEGVFLGKVKLTRAYVYNRLQMQFHLGCACRMIAIGQKQCQSNFIRKNIIIR